MERFEKNWQYIQEIPRFHVKPGFCQHSLEYSLIPSREEVPGLLCHRDEERVTIHSAYCPLKEAGKMADSLPPEPGDILIFGMGLGYHIPCIVERFPGAKVTVIEPDKHLFNLALKTIDIETCGDNTRFLIGWDEWEVPGLIRDLDARFEIVDFKARTRISPQYFGTLEKRLLHKPVFGVGEAWKYPKFRGDKCRILFIDSGYVLTKECLTAIQSTGNVFRYIHIDQDKYTYDEFIRNFLTEIGHFRPDFILTINHLGFDQEGRLTELLSELEIPYASWFVDSPTVILTGRGSNISDWCNIFVWDRDYLDDVKQSGYPHVDYLPLATSTEVFRPLNTAFVHDVSFVGSSMVYSTHKNLRSMVFRNDLLSALDPVARQFLSMETRYVSHATAVLAESGLRLAFDTADQQADFEAAVLWRATQMHRMSGIAKLAPFYPTVFGDPNWDMLLDNRYHIRRELLYYEQLCPVYNATRINFNMTSRQMKNAVNQRVFDVPACRRFLLTDYKAQLDELFDLGKTEIVCFRDVEEIPELVRFYLKNEDIRTRIALSGMRRILAGETYDHRIRQLVGIMRGRYGG